MRDVVQILDGGDRLRQLHQREDPLLHARAAGAATETSGTPRAIALSHARENFSPTALPIEPPMNAKSITASSSACSSIVAWPTTIASPSPVFSSASASRSVYGRRSKNAERIVRADLGGLLDERPVVGELLDPLARRHGKWWPQCPQT